MKLFTKLLVMLVLLSSCSIQKLKKKGVYKELTPEEYYSIASDTTNSIIDLRTLKEFEKGHIERAKNVSFFGGHFKNKVKDLQIDTTKTILIYCQTQHRSLFVSNKLYKMGYKNIIDLDKGFKAWKKQGLPFKY